MNKDKKWFSPRKNVVKFVDWEIPDFNSEIGSAKLLDALETDPEHIPENLLKLLPSRDGNGIVKISGWQFNFEPYLKHFIAKITISSGYDWSETKLTSFIGLSIDDVKNWIAEHGYGGQENVDINWIIPEPEEDND